MIATPRMALECVSLRRVRPAVGFPRNGTASALPDSVVEKAALAAEGLWRKTPGLSVRAKGDTLSEAKAVLLGRAKVVALREGDTCR